MIQAPQFIAKSVNFPDFCDAHVSVAHPIGYPWTL